MNSTKIKKLDLLILNILTQVEMTTQTKICTQYKSCLYAIQILFI